MSSQPSVSDGDSISSCGDWPYPANHWLSCRVPTELRSLLVRKLCHVTQDIPTTPLPHSGPWQFTCDASWTVFEKKKFSTKHAGAVIPRYFYSKIKTGKQLDHRSWKQPVCLSVPAEQIGRLSVSLISEYHHRHRKYNLFWASSHLHLDLSSDVRREFLPISCYPIREACPPNLVI